VSNMTKMALATYAGIGLAFAVQALAGQPTWNLAVGNIKTYNGHYLTAVDGGGLGGGIAPIDTNSVLGPLSFTDNNFTIVWLNSTFTQFALQTPDGRYVTAVKGGGIGGPNDDTSPIHTDATTAGPWEEVVLQLNGNTAYIISPMGQWYWYAVGGGDMNGDPENMLPIHTDATSVGAWETFTLANESVTTVTVTSGPGSLQIQADFMYTRQETVDEEAYPSGIYDNLNVPGTITFSGALVSPQPNASGVTQFGPLVAVPTLTCFQPSPGQKYQYQYDNYSYWGATASPQNLEPGTGYLEDLCNAEWPAGLVHGDGCFRAVKF
jgi:hypothetical protein